MQNAMQPKQLRAFAVGSKNLLPIAMGLPQRGHCVASSETWAEQSGHTTSAIPQRYQPPPRLATNP